MIDLIVLELVEIKVIQIQLLFDELFIDMIPVFSLKFEFWLTQFT